MIPRRPAPIGGRLNTEAGTPSDNDILQYDLATQKWQFVTPATVVGFASITDLSDIAADPDADALLLWNDSESGAEGEWITSIPDSFIAESSVTQHESALTILESQITDGSLLARVAEDETISGDWVFTGEFNIGDPGSESGSIQLDDASYSAVAKINEFGGSQDATLILHRHDTTATVAPNLVFAKTKSETSSHANVADNEVLGRLVFAGYHTDGYWTGARIEARVNGTPGDGDMPTELRFLVSADGTNSPTERLRLEQDGSSYFTGTLDVSSGITDGSITESSVTQHEAAIDHDALSNFVANEHIDWTGDAGSNNIHVNNITAVPEAAVTAHEGAIDHDSLTNFVAAEHIDWTSTSENFANTGTFSAGPAGAKITASGTEIDLTTTTIDINGTVDISGNLAVGNSITITKSGAAIISLRDSGAGSNEKQWEIRSASGGLYGYTDTDAGSASGTWLKVLRSGTTPTEIELNAPLLDLNGNVDISGTLDVGGNSVVVEVAGSFTATLTGCTTSPTATVYYSISGSICTLWLNANLTGTSNSTAMTFTGLPAACRPTNLKKVIGGRFYDAALGTHIAAASFSNTTTVTFTLLEGTGDGVFDTEAFTSSGTKGIAAGWCVTYALD